MNQQRHYGVIGPDIRRIIFEELGRDVDAMLLELGKVPVGQQSDWMIERAQMMILPYVRAQANPQIMMFWVGMIIASKMRRKPQVEELDIDIRGHAG